MRAATVVLAALAASSAGCIDYLDPGELGPVRYFGEIRGERPLPLFPPISDRDGNAYVLSGARELRAVNVYTGHAGGGWSSGCALHKADDRGTHGWVGRDQSHAWYWSGDALVEVDGTTGSCAFVLDRDPASAASIAFLGVIPAVREAPSRISTVALLQSPNDRLPYWAVIDLGQRRYTELRVFEPSDAGNVVVLGTGAVGDDGDGVMMIRFDQGGQTHFEARFVDAAGRETDRTAIVGVDPLLSEDAILGELSAAGGVTAGLLSNGQLVTIRGGSGAARTVSGLVPTGVHRGDDGLWVVGASGSQALLAPLGPDGTPGATVVWEAASRAAQTLAGGIQVLDDRAAPRRYLNWSGVVSAIGDLPFLSSSPPITYAQDTALWLVAGPSYIAGGGDRRTSVGLVPIGIHYP